MRSRIIGTLLAVLVIIVVVIGSCIWLVSTAIERGTRADKVYADALKLQKQVQRNNLTPVVVITPLPGITGKPGESIRGKRGKPGESIRGKRGRPGLDSTIPGPPGINGRPGETVTGPPGPMSTLTPSPGSKGDKGDKGEPGPNECSNWQDDVFHPGMQYCTRPSATPSPTS